MNMCNFTQVLNDEAATLLAGQAFSKDLPAGMTVFLHGDLGAGKTTFVRGVLQGMGYQGKVKSPTYTLVEPYQIANKTIYHFDLYRLIDDEEWEEAGFRDYFNTQSICMIEWPEKAQRLLPQADIDIFLSHQAQGRQLRYQANSLNAQQFLQQLNT
ncbi:MULTISPECIES: tRNA (adenosine(37)-N6)-threonylcarbamoyltransferase complex ATPase subunit type 1 TsaE [unclassified Methylotenera]|jgi:tRNA threonylcarbamoyladenosine biosynthesis protein TsaE|uniref:tRNA (adenosine(37)-N6)-threonylcarbamoyltransferase complex ATPase subunit type 1 TsaE n=1 Tax=unclassified Methylotenera TaxID=2643294 RepID=UPI00035FDA45|nr:MULTISPECIES: tRNA (adenosine(37)-N6)-threonylcarbamoyltransferase complex ATPase subunit type 1 TsaE [unclassified Methylotenera]